MVSALSATGAAAEWLSLRSDHFEAVGNTSSRELRDVALRFEQFRDIVRRLDPSAVPDASDALVRIVVFRDTKSFEPFMPRIDGRRVAAAGMFVEGPGRTYLAVALDKGDDGFRVVFHEYAHLLLRRAFADAPLWFHEGIAEYYSTLRITGNRSAQIGRPVGAHLKLLREHTLSLTRLFALTDRSPEYTSDAAGRLLAYAQAWAVVHHAFHGEPKRRAGIVSLAEKLSAGG